MAWRVASKIEAIDDEGASHTIVEMRDGLLKDFVLQSGWAITEQHDGTFTVDETGQILRPVSR